VTESSSYTREMLAGWKPPALRGTTGKRRLAAPLRFLRDEISELVPTRVALEQLDGLRRLAAATSALRKNLIKRSSASTSRIPQLRDASRPEEELPSGRPSCEESSGTSERRPRGTNPSPVPSLQAPSFPPRARHRGGGCVRSKTLCYLRGSEVAAEDPALSRRATQPPPVSISGHDQISACDKPLDAASRMCSSLRVGPAVVGLGGDRRHRLVGELVVVPRVLRNLELFEL